MKRILLFVMLSVTLSFSGCGSDAPHQNSAEQSESSFDFIKPHFNADASLKLYVGPELDLLIYDVAGPSAELDAYLQATVDLLGNPWWKLFWGLGATAGFDLRILNHEVSHVSFDVFDYRHELADAGNPFP